MSLGGVVVVQQRAEGELAGVPAALIEAHGAVSEPVAAALAEGIRSRPARRLGVGITGIAGPSGGTPQKPVGTVAIAVASRRRCDARPHVLALRFALDDQVPGGADGARHGAPDSAGNLRGH